MKKPLLILAVFLVVLSANAQVHKIFLNAKGAEVDSTHAEKYAICGKLSDTAWVMKLYKMNDTIIEEGNYKDQSLTIPNGKFKYYYKNLIKRGSKEEDNMIIDTLNYISLEGNYVNGVKSGKWISYFAKGGIDHVNTYSDNKLNGLYELYDYDTNTVLLSGNYIDNMRQGEWHLFDRLGNITKIDMYEGDKIIKSKTIPSPYQQPEPPKNFISYLKESARYLSMKNINGKVILSFDITAQGKVINPKIFDGRINAAIDTGLLSILSKSPDWKPAYDTTLKKNINSNTVILISLNRGVFKFQTGAIRSFFQVAE